ncbi:MAG: lysophospholipid acyltransferase family protein [Acidimicrobiia bacterium]
MLRLIRDGFRTVLGFTLIVVATILMGTLILVLARIRPASKLIEGLARTWSRLFLAVAGLRYHTEGIERLGTERSYVIVSNHLSGLDPMLHIATMPVPVLFLAKKELFKLPIFGAAMRAIGVVETDRQGGVAAHTEINRQVKKVVELDRSLVIYPEGTRSRTAEMLPFKKGAFRIANDNALTVVPVTTIGTAGAWRPGGKLLRGGRARVIVHEPIPVDGLDASDIGRIRDQARETIAASYESLREQPA